MALIILVAVALSAARVLIPDIASYRSYVEEQLAQILEHPVKIGDLNALISGITPIVIFHDVKLISSKNGKELLEIDKIKIGFSIWRSIKEQKAVPSIYTIDGVELAIIRQKDGKILIQDVDVAELGSAISGQELSVDTELSEWLFKRSSLVIQNSSIVWHDKKRLTKPTRFKNVTLKLKNNLNRHQFNGEFILSNKDKKNPKRLELALDVYGDMLDPLKWVGKFYANGKNINASEWGFKPVVLDVMVEKGRLDFKLWGDWVAGELNKIEADIKAHDVILKRLKNKAVANVSLLSGLVKWNKDINNWDLSIENLKYVSDKGAWPETELKIERVFNEKDKTESIKTKVKYCRIEDVRDLLLKSGYVEDRVFKYLRKAAPSGELENIEYKGISSNNELNEYFLSAKVKNLSLSAFEKIPGLKGVSGELFSNQNSGLLSINTVNSQLDFQGILLEPITVNKLTGNVEWIKNKKSWTFSSNEIQADNDDVSTLTSFNLNIPNDGTSPLIDLQSKLKKGKASAIKKYLPSSILKGEFKSWVDSAFISGIVESGGIILNGRLDKFPYDNNDGVFKAQAYAKDIELNYKESWPHLKNGVLDVIFSGLGMQAKIEHVDLLNSSADDFQVSINNLNKPLLKVKGHMKSNLDDIAQFSSKTFLKGSRDFVNKSRFSGETNIDIFMDIPLSDIVEKTYPLNIKAKAFLVDANLSTAKDKLYATSINGMVELTENSVSAKDIDAKILDGKSKVDIFTRHQFGGHPIRLVMQGNIDVSKTMQSFKLPGYDKVSGRTDWQGVFTLEHKQDGVVHNPIFQVTADMEDVVIDLPIPMTKAAKIKIPTYMTVENVSYDNMLLHLVYGEKMSFAMDIDLSNQDYSRLRRGEFRFKPHAASIPNDNTLRLTGSLKDFSLRDWLDALDPTSDNNKKSFFDIPVKVNMDNLHLAKAKDQKPRKPSDPRKLPTFEGKIKHFQYDTYPYGQFTFKTVNEKRGLNLEKFTITSPFVNTVGSAYWYYHPKRQSTEVTMNVESENYGDLLTSLGFAKLMENGKASFSGDFNWDGGFGSFSWETLNGVITMDIYDGLFTKVDPGAGRLIGLLSIESLPGMIFSGDAFKAGFSFDRITGAYEVENGNAYTDGLSISGSAAEILVTGRIGLAKQDFDEHLTVVPNVSGTLPLTTGSLFGPQVGAVVYFFKKLFGSGIDESTQRIYHLTGTWNKPVTTRIDTNDDVKSEAEKKLEDTENTDDDL